MRAALTAAREAVTTAAALYPAIREEVEADPVAFAAHRAAEVRAEVERLTAAMAALTPRPEPKRRYTNELANE